MAGFTSREVRLKNRPVGMPKAAVRGNAIADKLLKLTYIVVQL